ncbi:MAG: tRNA (adenosine(37)-N6)-dimethylallyltransferase MiaA [Candidatus Omnitrophica bacterium]|nr:tRNA (adenosine(37)-N6)-dimethylallyltransferase MiaA [Candidatus Omnitrophota bacterium]
MGPTATGKTDISLEVAARLDAEIVNCDSMQVYRGMPVLSQQPTAAQRKMVPHHLFDLVEPTESFNVGQYRRAALDAVNAIQARGKAVLFVGGTGLYLKALTHGLCEAPPGRPEVREALWQAIEGAGAPALHARLKSVDPRAAKVVHPNDARRVVRAMEVYESTGQPLSSFWERTSDPSLAVQVIGLTRERAELYERINQRVVRMLDDEGVLEEARRVGSLPLSRTALQVHGLRYLRAYLAGEATREETIASWQQQVRNYARRQGIWFRAVEGLEWVTVSSEETPSDAAARVHEVIQHSPATPPIAGRPAWKHLSSKYQVPGT